MEAPRKATEEELMGRSRGQQRGGPGGGGQFGGGGGGGGGEPGRALYDFTPSGSNQVAIRAGESIQIVNDSNAQVCGGAGAFFFFFFFLGGVVFDVE